MSIARHHNEWLSLLEVSGPFLSLPVLIQVFPQGLEEHDSEVAKNLRLAYDEWDDNQDDTAIHRAWIEYILKAALEYPDDYLLEGQSLPPGLEARLNEHNETLRPTWALKAPSESQARMLVCTYPPAQKLDKPVSGTAWKASPDTRMMTLLQAANVPLGLVTNGEQWMLVSAQRGQTTSYITWYASLWGEEPLTLRAFRALLGVRRFFGVPENETLTAMLAESLQNQQEVTDQLGFQVRKAVEMLIQALDRINIDQQGRLLEGLDEKALYEAALTMMMRLVFLFSAEERGLLLLGDPLYDRCYAISTLRDQLREVADNQGEEILEHRHDAWSRLLATFRVIFGGVEHESLRLPAYGGALFDPDRYPFLEGRARGTSWKTAPAALLPLSNRTVLHLLEALQFLQLHVAGAPAEARRLSFRALDIEQIGHVYEGLLDHTAVRARSTVLGLVGSQGNDPEVVLEDLARKATESEDALVEFLREKTGRSAAALRRAVRETESLNAAFLQVACGNDRALYARVAPFAQLIRDDTHGYPVVILAGSVFVTAGADRRSTGTHYTPRSLTEPVVKTTLDPLLYDGVDQGEEPTPERLKKPEQILALRVCDLACGSGAFLVQACRYLAERLVEAWAIAESRLGSAPLVIPEGEPAAGHHGEQLLPKDDEERLALARRLVAERCLYGVDINPMAVEMAKLSLWLVTLHKNRPFTFLDHAIKCGDSLVGLHRAEQVTSFHLKPERAEARGRIFDYVTVHCTELLERARKKREQLERFTVLDIRDAEYKAKLHREAEAAIEVVRVISDLVAGAGLVTASGNESRSLDLLDTRLNELVLHVADTFAKPELLRAAEPDISELRRLAWPLLNPNGVRQIRRPFHWLVEFPEVFLHTENPGFDALIGNPPFVGGKKITGLFGDDYRDYLVLFAANGRRGSADLCAYFVLRAGQLLRIQGNFGLLTVNTIAEGDTRQVSLEAMARQGYVIYGAVTDFAWPGAAAVVASEIHLHRGTWQGKYDLNHRIVPTISAFLSDYEEWSPAVLRANRGIAFIGSVVVGLGFVLSDVAARGFIAKDNKYADVLFPYLNGEDLNSDPEQRASRWVINFWDWPLNRTGNGNWANADEAQRNDWIRAGSVPVDYPGRVAEDFPDLLDIVRKLVKPERDLNKRAIYRERWWHFAEKCPGLYHAIGRGAAFAKHPESWESNRESQMSRVLVRAQVSRTHAPVFVQNNQVISMMCVAFASNDEAFFAVLQSSVHEAWLSKYSSSLKTDQRYTPSDSFETFPFPDAMPDALRIVGDQYHALRADIMKEKHIGLTSFYGLFHNPECADTGIKQARRLHEEIDQAVLDAYSWRDIVLQYGFSGAADGTGDNRARFAICDNAHLEILRRLSKLNRERYEEEQREVARQVAELTAAGPAKKRGPGRGRNKLTNVQGGLF